MTLLNFKASNHPQQTAKNGATDEVDDRGTDPAFIAALEKRFGKFDLSDVDACAHAEALARAAREDVAEAPHCTSCTCGRRAPLQGESASSRYGAKVHGTISWDEHLECHAAYAVQHSGQSAETIAARGGFGWGEFVMFVGREPRTWRAR